MRRVLRWQAACLLGLLSLWVVAPVQAQQPMVVLSVRSVDELLDDAGFIGETIGQAGARKNAENFLEFATGGAGLAGVDQSKPLGLYSNMTAAGETEKPVVFVPISDAEAFRGVLKSFAPDLKESNGIWTMTVNGTMAFAKFSNGYCFASVSPAVLGKPADPKKIVNTKYDVALDINIASIPQPIKDQFLQQAEIQGRASLETEPDAKSDAESKGRKLGLAWSLAVLTALTNEGDLMTLGFDINSKTQLGAMDFGLTGKANTELAKAMTAYGKMAPAFAATVPNKAPFQLVWSVPTTGLLENLDDLFDGVRGEINAEIDRDPKLNSDAKREAVKAIARRFFDIGQATAKSGALHSVVILEEGDDDTVRFVAGTKIANGDDAGKLVDDVVKLSKEHKDVAKVKLDAAKHAGARIHAITGDLDEETIKRFGEGPAHLAVRADSLWLSLGGGNLDALKKALDLSGKTPTKPVAPISLRVKPATLVTLMEKDDKGLVERAKALAGKPGDVLNVEVAPITRGAKLHIEFGVDLFKLGMEE